MVAGRRVVAALLMPLGVVVAHALAYAFAHPDGADRARALGTVHGHLVPLAVLGVVWGAMALWWAGRAGAAGVRLGLTPGRLVGLQVTAFAVMEVAERLAEGYGWHTVVHEPAVLVGLAVQALVAVAAWALVRVSERVGACLARRAARPPRARFVRFPRERGRVRAVPLSPLSRRGPPAPAAA